MLIFPSYPSILRLYEREHPPAFLPSHVRPSVSSYILELGCKAKREECGNVDAIWKPGDASQDTAALVHPLLLHSAAFTQRESRSVTST